MRHHLIACLLAATAACAAERINHEGRILGTLPAVTTPTLFNTPAADAVVAAMQIMPRDNPWNEDISTRPLLANSAAMMDVIRAQFSASRQRAVLFEEMNYVLVPDAQPLVDINFTLYYEDADFNGGTSPIGRYPIPTNQPVEAWPANGEELYAYQRMTGGDRHSITVQPGVGRYFETWLATLTSNTPAWEASNGAVFNLASNAIRTPDGIGSGDAAGLPMFPALVRYDEIQRGVVEHALRLIVGRTRDHHIYPATHDASVPRTTDPNVPAMGERLRLKSSFVIPASWSAAERAVGVALKKYGAIMADNGGFFSMSICPDDRWAPGTWSHFTTGAASDFLDISNFEVVQTTGPNEGPRSPNPPTAHAGADQTTYVVSGATLVGSATGSGLTTQWYAYNFAAQPGTVTFGTPNALTTTASFSAPGTYTLMLKASDGVHTPAYDAVVVTVNAGTPDAVAPTITTPASGPGAVAGTTAALSVVASDNLSTTLLTYTWTVASWSGGGASGATFSPNGTNAAANTTMTFHHAGSYTCTVTVRDSGGNTVNSTTGTMVVAQTPTAVTIAETALTVAAGGSLVLHASLRDQFADAISAGTAVWTVLPGGAGGSIAVDGTYTAPAAPTVWTDQVRATFGALNRTAVVTIIAPGGGTPTASGSGGGSCGAGGTAGLILAGLCVLGLRRRRGHDRHDRRPHFIAGRR